MEGWSNCRRYAVGLGYWGIKSITKEKDEVGISPCIHCGSDDGIARGGAYCIDCGRHPFNHGRPITAKEDDGYSDYSDTVFDAESKRPHGMTSTRFRHKETGEIATQIPISEMRMWEKLDAEESAVFSHRDDIVNEATIECCEGEGVNMRVTTYETPTGLEEVITASCRLVGRKVLVRDKGLIIMAKKKHTITTVEVDILPSRLEYFERRMEKIAAAAEAKDIPFKYDVGNVVLKPLPPHLISLAQSNQLSGTQQLPNGNWVREVVPVEIKHGELTHTGFEYVGDLEYGEVQSTATGAMRKQVIWNVSKLMSPADITRMTPQIKARRFNFNKHGSYACDHCNMEGDLKTRHHILLFRSKKDQKVKGKKKAKRETLELKKDEIVQVGTACSLGYTGLNLADIAAFYGRDRAVPATGAHASPRNPCGMGLQRIWR